VRIAKRAAVEAMRRDRRQLHRRDCLHRPWPNLYWLTSGRYLRRCKPGVAPTVRPPNPGPLPGGIALRKHGKW